MGEASYGTKIQNCSFKGSVSGENCIGGIVGRYYGGSTVSGCYANADITATAIESYAGGIAGQILVGNDSKSVNANTSNCYFVNTSVVTMIFKNIFSEVCHLCHYRLVVMKVMCF